MIPEGYMIDRSARPAGQHLVKMQETSRVLASEALIQVVRKYKLTGITFEECGRYVR